VNRSAPCCKDPAALAGAPSPFPKILALGFYDGPTAGVLQCGCGAAYRFDMLDWDGEHRVRVFRLAALPRGSLDQCAAAFAQSEPPRWPVWVPWSRTSPPAEVRDAVNREVDRVLAEAGPPDLVVAWTGYGEKVLAARRLPAEDLQGVPDWFSAEGPGRDWFALLGLTRQANGESQPGPGAGTPLRPGQE
jgi:hypothetical protein